MAEHTPGPWHIIQRGLGAPEVISSESGRRIAKVLYHTGSEDEQVMPNARLIVAAPELLGAIRGLVAVYGTKDFTGRHWDRVIAAIAKAEGKEA